MKILFVWTGLTSYMTDCWRELAAQPDVSLRVVVENHVSGRSFDPAKVMAGLDAEIVDEGRDPMPLFAPQGRWAGWKPDVIFAVGWHSPAVRNAVLASAWRDVPKVCCFDLPWDGSVRRIAARWVLRPFLRHYAVAYVPGAACARYAAWLRFPRIRKGLFAIDAERFRKAGEARGTARRGFLYMGRFGGEKRLDLLVAAYARYRERGGAWPLDLYGAGEPPALDGIPPKWRPAVHGFVQPDEAVEVYSRHACFVLASDFDPWPLVLLQACANGLPFIASDRCTNHFELARENAILFPHGDAAALADALLEMERTGREGRAGHPLAAPYDKTAWTRRTLEICKELTQP